MQDGGSRTVVVCSFKIFLDLRDAFHDSLVKRVARIGEFIYEGEQRVEGLVLLPTQHAHGSVCFMNCGHQGFRLNLETLYRIHDRRGRALMNEKLIRSSPA